MAQPTSLFAFALCQPGAELRLKNEIKQLCPELRSAFQRPGIVTFKSTGGELRPDVAPRCFFARAWGCSGGVAKSVEDARSLFTRLEASFVFVGPRLPEGVVPDEWRALESLNTKASPSKGELVLDVIVHPDEPTMLGWHTHGASRHVTPSGLFSFTVPEEAPSRAYGKAVEGLLWSGADVRPKEVLLEVGAAPGGASLAYLERGLHVFAVDAQALSPVIVNHPGLIQWMQVPIGEVGLHELPRRVHWLSIDANIAPTHAVRSLLRLFSKYQHSLRGALLTLKLNDEAAISTLSGALRQLEVFGTVDAIQLPTNRGDLFVYVATKNN